VSRQPTSLELTSDLIAWSHDDSYPDRGEHPVWCWERWIRDDPERAWTVFEELVRQAPHDVEVIERVAQRLEQLLFGHWADFYSRAVRLVQSTPLLEAMTGPEVLTRGYYGPRYRDLRELASVWVRHNAHCEASHRVTDIMRTDPEPGLTIALEIIRRGPLHGFDEWDLSSPLLELLRCHGPSVIAEVEAEARSSKALRRLIWGVRRLNPTPDTAYSISSEVWGRLMRAAATTTLYNSERPSGTRVSLSAEYDRLLDRWFISESTFWAWEEVDRLVREDPPAGWQAVLALVQRATEDKALVDIGCGPLEDLIRGHPDEFVEAVEQRAAADTRFRLSLGCVWLTLEDVPETLARRYWAASGEELAVLDAPEGWPSYRDAERGRS
jgi:hypothetical protein